MPIHPNARTLGRSCARQLGRMKFRVLGCLIPPAHAVERLDASDIRGDQMSVLTVAGQKGGSGKTNLVRNLAIQFALDGYGVGLVDADLIQQHSSEFFADRQREGAREIWIPRSDIPGLTVAVWDRGSPEVPKASIVVAPQVDQDAIGDVIQSLVNAVERGGLRPPRNCQRSDDPRHPLRGSRAHPCPTVQRRPKERSFYGTTRGAGREELSQGNPLPNRDQSRFDGLSAGSREGSRGGARERRHPTATNTGI